MDSKLHRFAAISVIALCGTLLVMFAARYVVSAVLPFLFAWGLAFLLRPAAKKISKALRMNERAVRLLLAMLVSALLILIVVVSLWYIANKSWQFLSGLNSDSEIVSAITSFLNGGFFSKFLFGGELGAYIKSCIDTLVSGLLEALAGAISGVAAKLPGAFVFILISIIASAYFAYDLERINSTVVRILPKRVTEFLVRIKSAFAGVGIKYIKSYFILMLVTFATMLVGLLIIGVEYATIIALGIAFLDILPVLGVGTVLIPWSVIAFITSDVKTGVGLIILFLISSVLRQFIEPKILGKNLGLHPILTLLLLYVGYSFFGIAGMVLLPPVGALIAVLLSKDDPAEVA